MTNAGKPPDVKVLFLDESGDHSLDSIDNDYPVFVLGGIIVDRSYYRSVIEPSVRQLKQDFFDEPVVLHTTDIIRARNGFERLTDTEVRSRFYEALNAVMRELEYSVVACAINKFDHKSQYGDNAADPYDYCLEIVIERFVKEIGTEEHGGIVFAERRRPDLDKSIQVTWNNLRRSGCGYARAEHVDGRIVDLSLKDKFADMPVWNWLIWSYRRSADMWLESAIVRTGRLWSRNSAVDGEDTRGMDLSFARI